MLFLDRIFSKAEKLVDARDEIAKLLKVDPEAFRQFEEVYKKEALSEDASCSDNLFEISAKQAAGEIGSRYLQSDLDDIANRIVDELLAQTKWYEYDGCRIRTGDSAISGPNPKPVTQSELNCFPKEMRPQLTGNLMKKDIDEPAYFLILDYYKRYLQSPNSKEGKRFYSLFRQGLDILDLDPVTYEIIGMNQNSIGNWFPPLVKAIQKQDFFHVPATTIIKVPMTLLQLTRCSYNELTPATMAVVNRFCEKVFRLNRKKEYFVKTGTYSSKFDFRNAYVHGEKEVRELGEYLLYIHFSALQMASPLCSKQIYGVSTTNEWAVREFIPDKESNPTIYKGMPLHTEYRVFVDFDTKQIIGVAPYWHPEVMEKRFGHEEDSNSPHQIHDYIVFKAHEDVMMQRYETNVDTVCDHIETMLPDIELNGQWSIDIMQNGNEFWIIDMALAQNSALVEYVPQNLLRNTPEVWLPRLAPRT